MGDIKKSKKKYFTPSHPWQKSRIESENILLKEYGLRRKKEIWKMGSVLKKFKDQAKSLTAREGSQAELEKRQLMARLASYGFLSPGDPLENVLGLEIKDVMERRLQTLVFRRNLARSMDQARQFITHHHISVQNQKITVPSYLVAVGEEGSIAFSPKSSLYDIEHPERVREEEKDKLGQKKKPKTKAELTEEEKKLLTEEEIEAKEIEAVLGSEEDREIKKLEQETPDQEVKEIITEGKTEMEKLQKQGKK